MSCDYKKFCYTSVTSAFGLALNKGEQKSPQIKPLRTFLIKSIFLQTGLNLNQLPFSHLEHFNWSIEYCMF